jgi:hypothetical protein
MMFKIESNDCCQLMNMPSENYGMEIATRFRSDAASITQ